MRQWLGWRVQYLYVVADVSKYEMNGERTRVEGEVEVAEEDILILELNVELLALDLDVLADDGVLGRVLQKDSRLVLNHY